jgi:hypothetical protein
VALQAPRHDNSAGPKNVKSRDRPRFPQRHA